MRYSIIFHGAYSPLAFGFPVMTIWSGEFTKQKKRDFEFEGTAIALLNKDVKFPGQPEIWAVRYQAKPGGCDTFKFVHDFFGGYHWGPKYPFRMCRIMP